MNRTAIAQRVAAYERIPERTEFEQWIVDSPADYQRTVRDLLASTEPADEARREIMLQTAISGWEASSRLDLELNGVRSAGDVVIDWIEDFLPVSAVPTRTVGWEAASSSFREFVGDWAEWRVRLQTLVDHTDHMILMGVAEARGRASGVPVTMGFCQVYRLRDGLVSHVWNVSDPGSALEIGGIDRAVLPAIEALPEGGWMEISHEHLSDPAAG